MPRSTKGRRLAAFKSSVTVDVYQPEFEIFQATKHLDAAKLARAARAEIEVGAMKMDCCKTIVRAVIRKGMVTGLRVDTAEGNVNSVHPELMRHLNEVRRRYQRRRRPSRFPVPLSTFLSAIPRISMETITCYVFCIFSACVMCCYIDSQERWICTPRGIIVTPDPRK